MFTVGVKDYALFSQDYYDSVINSLDLSRLACSCKAVGCFRIHGYYSRKVRTAYDLCHLRVCRVRCMSCGRTHAILLSSMVPHSQIPVHMQRDMVCDYEAGRGLSLRCSGLIDENNVKAVRLRYRRYWRGRIGVDRYGKKKAESPASLVEYCFERYSRQFMQISKGTNILLSETT